MYKVERRQDAGKPDCVFIDISVCDAKEFQQMLTESGKLIRSYPEKSVNVLTIVSEYTPIFTDAAGFLNYLSENRPHVKHSVVAVTEPMRKAMFEGIVAMSRRPIKVVSTAEEAEEYLRSGK